MAKPWNSREEVYGGFCVIIIHKTNVEVESPAQLSFCVVVVSVNKGET
jgi:hypothetical protein